MRKVPTSQTGFTSELGTLVIEYTLPVITQRLICDRCGSVCDGEPGGAPADLIAHAVRIGWQVGDEDFCTDCCTGAEK